MSLSQAGRRVTAAGGLTDPRGELLDCRLGRDTDGRGPVDRFQLGGRGHRRQNCRAPAGPRLDGREPGSLGPTGHHQAIEGAEEVAGRLRGRTDACKTLPRWGSDGPRRPVRRAAREAGARGLVCAFFPRPTRCGRGCFDVQWPAEISAGQCVAWSADRATLTPGRSPDPSAGRFPARGFAFAIVHKEPN